MMEKCLRDAAENNARWCDAVCRAHGCPGEFQEGLWVNLLPVPPFYPNAVTTDERAVVAQLQQIQRITARLGSGWGVKDSFRTLDLVPLGFRPLFDATWIYRAADLALLGRAPCGVRWDRIPSAPGPLAEWETSWRGGPHTAKSRQFPPALLHEEGVAFLAARRGGVGPIVAGAIVNRTGEVAGLSNVFAQDGDLAGCWTGCVALASALFPGLPLAGYEQGAQLDAALAAGFEPLGSLRVWLKAADSDLGT
jgi:hypothetical protein